LLLSRKLMIQEWMRMIKLVFFFIQFSLRKIRPLLKDFSLLQNFNDLTKIKYNLTQYWNICRNKTYVLKCKDACSPICNAISQNFLLVHNVFCQRGFPRHVLIFDEKKKLLSRICKQINIFKAITDSLALSIYLTKNLITLQF